jgi:hypothetical protein
MIVRKTDTLRRHEAIKQYGYESLMSIKTLLLVCGKILYTTSRHKQKLEKNTFSSSDVMRHTINHNNTNHNTHVIHTSTICRHFKKKDIPTKTRSEKIVKHSISLSLFLSFFLSLFLLLFASSTSSPRLMISWNMFKIKQFLTCRRSF